MISHRTCRLALSLFLATAWLLASAANPGRGAEEKKPPIAAPPNHALLANTFNGWYFVPRELKERFDATLAKLESLRATMDLGHLRSAEAKAELRALGAELADLRTKIEASRILVAGAMLHEQKETIEFELGPERRLAITTNHVHVVGWDGPNVKVELRKIVLAPDKQPVDEHLQAIKIVHQHGPAEFAGKTDEEWEADERKFRSTAGAALSPDELARRDAFVADIRQSYAIYRSYLGKDVDQITVAGLDYAENSVITLQVKSEGGDGQMQSLRQRYAELTVYVPRCQQVCVRGARRGLLVENLFASLTIASEGSTDSDHRGRFEVDGLKGDLVSKGFPLQRVANVDGHVTVQATPEFGVEGGGTSHHDDLRDMTPARPLAVEVHQVTGGADLQFGRVRLDLRNVHGKLNVWNEFGDTSLVAESALADDYHRIVTQSGRIDVELSAAAWSSIPVVAVSNHGGVRTNVPREEFDDFHLEGPDGLGQMRRSWTGFRTVVPDEDRFAVFLLLDRFRQVFNDQQRPRGLDLLSRGGRIVVLRK